MGAADDAGSILFPAGPSPQTRPGRSARQRRPGEEVAGIIRDREHRHRFRFRGGFLWILGVIDATGSDHVKLHLDTFHMNIEEANPGAAIRLAADRIGYFHIGESNRGFLGDGTIDFDEVFDALGDIGYDREITFESFSMAIVDEALSVVCGIWRDTWTDNDPLAAHAKTFIEMKHAEALRRRATNARP